MKFKVRFTWMGEPAVATLGDDRMWRTPDPTLAADLNTMPDTAMEFHSPADGWPGFKQADAAARLLGGVAEMPPAPDEPPGRIY